MNFHERKGTYKGVDLSQHPRCYFNTSVFAVWDIYKTVTHFKNKKSNLTPPQRVHYTPTTKVVNILPIKGSLYQE